MMINKNAEIENISSSHYRFAVQHFTDFVSSLALKSVCKTIGQPCSCQSVSIVGCSGSPTYCSGAVWSECSISSSLGSGNSLRGESNLHFSSRFAFTVHLEKPLGGDLVL